MGWQSTDVSRRGTAGEAWSDNAGFRSAAATHHWRTSVRPDSSELLCRLATPPSHRDARPTAHHNRCDAEVPCSSYPIHGRGRWHDHPSSHYNHVDNKGLLYVGSALAHSPATSAVQALCG